MVRISTPIQPDTAARANQIFCFRFSILDFRFGKPAAAPGDNCPRRYLPRKYPRCLAETGRPAFSMTSKKSSQTARLFWFVGERKR